MRDPRVSPQAGDVLTKRGKNGKLLRRVVDRVAPLGKGGGFNVYYNGRSQSTWSETWKSWAQNANVVNPASSRPEWARQPTPSMELVAVASSIEGWASNLGAGISDAKEASEKIRECCTRLIELADHLGEAKWT